MQNQIIINIPEGKKAIQETDKDGNIIIKYVDAEPTRSKSWEEFCENHPSVENECFVSNNSDITKVNPGRLYVRRSGIDNNLLATKKDVEAILALIQLTRLHDEWVGDWEPNKFWYSICVFNDEIDVIYWNKTQFLLSFPTEILAREFLDCFKDLIEKAKKFI